VKKKEAYFEAIKKYTTERPIFMCTGLAEAAKAAKKLIKSSNGQNQWLSRIFYGGQADKKDPASILCKNSDWESKMDPVEGMNFVNAVFSEPVDPRIETEEILQAHIDLFPDTVHNALSIKILKIAPSAVLQSIKAYQNTVCTRWTTRKSCKREFNALEEEDLKEDYDRMHKIMKLCDYAQRLIRSKKKKSLPKEDVPRIYETGLL